VLLGGKRSGEMNAGVLFQKVDCLIGSVSTVVLLTVYIFLHLMLLYTAVSKKHTGLL